MSILSEKELSELTHKLNLWKAKEDRIMRGEKQVDLSESDFNDEDAKIMELLDEMYPTSLIDNSHIIEIDNHYFIFRKQDAEQLTAQHFDTLSALSDNVKNELTADGYITILVNEDELITLNALITKVI